MSGRTVRLAAAIGILVISLAAAGCWDMRELQDRNYVLAVAVDTADEGELSGQSSKVKKLESFIQPAGEARYRMSLQILRLVQGGEKKEKKDPRTFVISNTGQSMFEMVRDMLGQSSKGLYFEHIQAIIISEAAVRQAGLRPILDWITRDPEGRWRVSLFITPGQARPFLEYQPSAGDTGGQFYAQLARQWKRNPYIAGAVNDVGFAFIALKTRQPVILPRIDMEGDVVKTGGFALFKQDKFVTYIDEYDTLGGKLIKGLEKSGIITIPCKDNPQQVLAFEIFRHDTNLKPEVKGDSISFTLDITLYGNISERVCLQKKDLKDPKYLSELEAAVADEVKRTVLSAHAKAQRLRVDMNGFGEALAAHYPRFFKTIKDKWDDEIFPEVSLQVSVHVSIRNIGEHK